MNLHGNLDTENNNLTYEITEKQISDLHDTNIDFDINSDNFFLTSMKNMKHSMKIIY